MDLIKTVLSNPYMKALMIVFASVLAAAIVKWIFGGILARAVKRSKTTFDDNLLDLLNKPVFYTVLLVGIDMAIHTLKFPDNLQYIFVGLIKTIVILIWTGSAWKFATMMLRELSVLPKSYKIVQPRTLPLFDNLGKIIIFSGAFYFLLLAWDLNITAWLASAGIVGIAVGFAAKDSLANLFAGFFIMVDAPYKVGDFINLDGGERGKITDIGLRSTRMLTRDDVEITIPNSVIAGSKIINESGGPNLKQRIRVSVGIAYGSDIDLVRETLLDIARSNSYVQEDPEPRVRFREFGESELSFQLLFWIAEPVLRGRVIDQLNSEIYKKFKEKNIEIPFPQRIVHMRPAKED